MIVNHDRASRNIIYHADNKHNDDLCEKYLNSYLIALCDCKKGRKIHKEVMYSWVGHTDGFCVWCHHAVKFVRVASDWHPDDGFKNKILNKRLYTK